MNNTFVFVRHGKTRVDKTTPIEDWCLTEEAKRTAASDAYINQFTDCDIIVSSAELKAIQTIRSVAEKLDKQIIVVPQLGEMKRPDGHQITLEEYDRRKEAMLADFQQSVGGWESLYDALQRFTIAMQQLDQQFENKKILIASHGTVMSLYFSLVANDLKNIVKRYNTIDFFTVGIITNKVEVDII